MFVSTEFELRSIVKLGNQLDVGTILNRVPDVTESFLVPLFGHDFVEVISNFFNSSTPEEEKLFIQVNRFIARMIVYQHVQESELDISDAGTNRIETDNLKTAYASQIERLLNSYETAAFKNLDSAIRLCYEYEFDGFDATPIFLSNKGSVFNSSADFTQYIRLYRSALTFFELASNIETVHEKYYNHRFSNTVRDAIKLAANDVTKSALKRIRIALANYTIVDAIDKGQLQLTSEGARFIGAMEGNSFRNETKPDIQAMSYQRAQHLQNAEMNIELVWQDLINYYTAFGLQSFTVSKADPKNFFV